MISQVLNAEYKSPTVVIPGLSPNSYDVLAVASARVYHAQLAIKNAEWCYSRLRGTLVFGMDRVQVGDVVGPYHRDNGVVQPEHHWFRLLDPKSGRPVWMFKIHTGFSYQVDRPFFHVFQGRVKPAFV